MKQSLNWKWLKIVLIILSLICFTSHFALSEQINNDGILNVKAFGAIGDGNADDTEAIQNAINNVPNLGGIVFFPAGIYKVTATIVINRPMSIMGSSRHTTYIRIPSNLTCDVFVISTEGYGKGVTIKDLTIDTETIINREAGAIEPGAIRTAGAGINITSAGGTGRNSHFENLNIWDQYDGIVTNGVPLFSCINNFFRNNKRCGIIVQNTYNPDQGDSIIQGNTFISPNAEGAAILQVSGGGLRILNNKILNHNHGIVLHLLGTTAILLIQANSIENQTGCGILLQRPDGSAIFNQIIVNGNQFANNGQPDIAQFNTGWLFNILIVSNTFWTGSSSKINIHIDGSSYGFITGNIFMGNGGTGIYLSNNTREYKIGTNHYFGLGTKVNDNSLTSHGLFDR